MFVEADGVRLGLDQQPREPGGTAASHNPANKVVADADSGADVRRLDEERLDLAVRWLTDERREAGDLTVDLATTTRPSSMWPGRTVSSSRHASMNAAS